MSTSRSWKTRLVTWVLLNPWFNQTNPRFNQANPIQGYTPNPEQPSTNSSAFSLEPDLKIWNLTMFQQSFSEAFCTISLRIVSWNHNFLPNFIVPAISSLFPRPKDHLGRWDVVSFLSKGKMPFHNEWVERVECLCAMCGGGVNF